jgi:hypothetical protein
MQDGLDGFTVELQVVPGCDCEAHGLAIQHAGHCKGFASELTREQVVILAQAFAALYDDRLSQGRRRRPLTKEGRALARQAIRYTDTLLGTEHRYNRN